MSGISYRAWRWVAPVALVGAVGLAACGDEDATVSRPASANVGGAAVAGSDVHLENQAAEIGEKTQQASRTSDDGNDEFVPGSRRMPMR
jgi:hypothetical protein